MLIPAIRKNSTTGYKNVTFNRSKRKFKVQLRDGGKCVFLGYFDTAEEAAIAYARSEYGRADAAKLLQPRAALTAAGAEAILQAEREGLTLVASSSNAGYKGVCYRPKQQGSKKYKLTVTVGGKVVHLGLFATAEQAALFYARREAGRDTSDLTAPPPPRPPPAPSTAAGAEAVRQAKSEGLNLATSSNSNSGYRGVVYYPKKKRSNKYQLRVRVGGKRVFLGIFATAEEAALARARHLWDTTVRLLEPQPQQAPPQGAAGPSEASSVEEDGFDPADIADATARSLLSDPPPSASEQRAARRQARAAEQAARVEAAAAAGAAPPCDDEVEVEAAAAAGVSAAAAAEEEALQCAICFDDLSAHREARLQRHDPNGWGATRCKHFFHYHCLHKWLNDDSEVETSRGKVKINTACPVCRGFVSKSAWRMLS